MDHSNLSRLPTEIRLAIYSLLFKNARIILSVQQKLSFGHSRPIAATLDFRQDTALVQTCHAIRGEALPILWSEAVVKATGYHTMAFAAGCVSVDRGVQLQTLSMLADRFPAFGAYHVAHLRGVLFPRAIYDTTASLLACFPRLRTCGVKPCGASSLDGLQFGCMRPAATAGSAVVSEEDFRKSGGSFLRRLVSFTPDRAVHPAGGFLRDWFGLDPEECKVQFLAQMADCMFPMGKVSHVDGVVSEIFSKLFFVHHGSDDGLLTRSRTH